jgi:hypothetical protein
MSIYRIVYRTAYTTDFQHDTPVQTVKLTEVTHLKANNAQTAITMCYGKEVVEVSLVNIPPPRKADQLSERPLPDSTI